MSATAGSAINQPRSHEQLRQQIEQQIEQYLAEGGQIRRLAAPEFQPQRSVSVRGTLAVD